MYRRISSSLLAEAFFLLASLVMTGSAAAPVNDTLREFLSSGNRSEGVFISELNLRQGRKTLPLYEQTGNEERRENLRQRLVLAPTDAQGPFNRGREIVARVERGQDLEIEVNLEHIRLANGASEVFRTPVTIMYVYFTPGQDLEHRLTSANGRYLISVPGKPYCGRVRCQIRSGDERHELSLAFINHRLPVTLIPRRRE